MCCLSNDVEWHGKKPQGLMDHFWKNCRKMTKEANALLFQYLDTSTWEKKFNIDSAEETTKYKGTLSTGI